MQQAQLNDIAATTRAQKRSRPWRTVTDQVKRSLFEDVGEFIDTNNTPVVSGNPWAEQSSRYAHNSPREVFHDGVALSSNGTTSPLPTCFCNNGHGAASGSVKNCISEKLTATEA